MPNILERPAAHWLQFRGDCCLHLQPDVGVLHRYSKPHQPYIAYTCKFNWEKGEEGLCDLKFYVHPLVHSVGGCHPTTGRPFIPTPHSRLPNGGLCPLECATQPMWSWSSMKSVEKGSHHQSIGYFPPTHDQKKNNNNKYIYTYIETVNKREGVGRWS